MARPDGAGSRRPEDRFERRIAAKEARMRRARRAGDRGVWFGLGMFGLVGWSVSIPVLAGTLLGVYLDRRANGGIAWTLSLMTLGFIVGSMNAWHWIERSRAQGEEETAGESPAQRRGGEDERSDGS